MTIALESHVARLQASVATVAHQERPEYLDRLSMLRNQVFVLDHMYMSLFSTLGWILRLGVTMALLASIHPALCCLAVFAVPTVLTSRWRPAVERAAQERGAQSGRLARHLFTIATTAAPGKEVRVTGIGERLVHDRRAAWERWYGPVAAVRWGSALWHALAWAIFGLAYVGRGGFRFVRISARRPARCCWCWPRARGSPATLAPPWARLDSCADSGWTARGGWPGSKTTRPLWRPRAICRFPATLQQGIRFDHVSFAYPGTARVVLDDVSLIVAGGRGGGDRRRERRRQDHSGQAARENVRALSGSILVDDTPLARMPAPNGESASPARSRISSASSSAPATPWDWAMSPAWTMSPP